VAQLADGGRLGTALVDRGVSRLIVGRKSGGAFGFLTVSDAGSPPLPGFERAKTFTF
jgi:protein-L-isoaspartate(D-aspartate) O-methyltransferase